MVFNFGQSKNTLSATIGNFERDYNVTLERLLQEAKQKREIVSTDEGI
jgi:hypothetical protein